MDDQVEFALCLAEQGLLLERKVNSVARVGLILVRYDDAAVVEWDGHAAEQLIARLQIQKETFLVSTWFSLTKKWVACLSTTRMA